MDISSHKITKVISSKSEIDNEKIMEQGCNFVEYATKKLVSFDRSIIVNSIKVDLTTSCTRADTIREKDITCSVNSLNAVFHSYTIQPTLNSNGQLHLEMFIGIVRA